MTKSDSIHFEFAKKKFHVPLVWSGKVPDFTTTPMAKPKDFGVMAEPNTGRFMVEIDAKGLNEKYVPELNLGVGKNITGTVHDEISFTAIKTLSDLAPCPERLPHPLHMQPPDIIGAKTRLASTSNHFL